MVGYRKDRGIISIIVERNSAAQGDMKVVSNVLASFGEEWLSLVEYSVTSTELELKLQVDEHKLPRLGAVQSSMELTIEYADGTNEQYGTDVFAHIMK